MAQKEEWQGIVIPINIAVKFIYDDDGKEGGRIKIEYNQELIKKSVGDFFINALKSAVEGLEKKNES